MTISGGRKRLEETLASHPLTDRTSVYRMVYDQLVKSSVKSKIENIWSDSSIDKSAEYWSHQVWAFLDLLRSVSGEETQNISLADEDDCSANGWKLKADTGQMRVMYREGPKGTPYHTLLAEGLIYSPLISSLCLAWETPFYSNWWPQFTVPSFKIVESRWVKRLRIGEDLSLIRLRVPWPLAMREVLMWAFELEYFGEELIIIILQSAPSPEKLDQKVHGFTAADVPDAKANTVRMELAGGFVLQRVTEEESYFRTIANLDIKLDFVPSWLINFLSRQLVGHGFHLYQKALSSISNGEGKSDVFKRLMETEPMYRRIQVGLHSRNASKHAETRNKNVSRDISKKGNPLCSNNPDSNEAINSEKQEGGGKSDNSLSEKERLSFQDSGAELPSLTLKDNNLTGESSHLKHCSILEDNSGHSRDNFGGKIDPEVQAALQLLDKMITYVHATTATAGSTNFSPLVQQLENATFLTKDLASSLDTSCSLSNQIDDQMPAGGLQEHGSSETSQSLDKDLQQEAGTDQLRETGISNGNADVLKARKPKLKENRTCFCFFPSYRS